tara:strand:- start:1367 stop:3442 length:2076 start_codon:yes stop_codon:yes gene_type:complete
MAISRNRRLSSLIANSEGTISGDKLTDGGGGGVDIFNTLDSLPMTSLSAGDQAFVEATSRLYVSNGSGWYNQGYVNKTPTWATEPDATYSITDSATPLIVVAKATDSDNSDINLLNQSVGTDSAQYMVSVSNDSSVFTFTPKSADSIGIEVAAGNLTDSDGDFIYTFKWSDGISFVSKAVTIAYSPGGGGSGPTATGFTQQLRDWGNILNPANSYYWPGTSHYNGTKQAPDGKYYMFGDLQGGGDGGWLAQLNEDGTFSWIRAAGSYYLRIYDIEFDGNDPIVLATDYGWGQNYSGSSPIQMYMAKFNGSGSRQWSKIFTLSMISSGNDATGNSANDLRKDSMGNFWSMFNYGANTDNPVNYTYAVTALMKFNGSGALQGVYLLPANGGHHNNSENLFIDENDNLFICGRANDPNATSYPHGFVSKFTLDSSGVPTYSWSKLFGQFSGSAHYDVPNKLYASSDGNLIVSGYTQQSNVNSTYYPTLMKMSAADGTIMWKKRYDSTYGEYGYASTIDNSDVIWMAGEKYNNSTSSYGFFIRTISATDGSHIALYEIDFTGQANPSVDNSGSYSWSQWRLGNFAMEKDNNGNVLHTCTPNGNGFDYRPTVTKLANPMIDGTFGGGAGTYSGNTILSTLSATPTDYTYDASILTHTSWSTINSVGGSFAMINYNSGSENDTVYTPTLTGQHGAIT